MGEIKDKTRILDFLVNAVLIHDIEGNIVHVNQSALNIFGIQSLPEALQRNLIRDFSADRSAAETFLTQLKNFKTNETLGFEWLAHISDERMRTMSVQVCRWSDEKDQNLFVTQLWDISVVKGIMAALHESEAKFRFLAENSADVIWQMDREFRFTYVSPSDERIRGFKPEELIGHSVLNQLTSDGIEYVKTINSERMEAENQGHKTGVIRHELEQLCKDGHYLWTEVNVFPYRDTSGRIVGFNGVTRDISERKESEKQLLEEKQKLEETLIDLRKAQDELKFLANYDSLTGLKNRRYFQEITEKEIERCLRYKHPSAMIMMDFDNFKNINDQYGHPIGDEVLIKVAKLIIDSAFFMNIRISVLTDFKAVSCDPQNLFIGRFVCV